VVRLLENGADARVMNGGEMLVELMVGRMWSVDTRVLQRAWKIRQSSEF
jgi:hypothetical protein